MSNKVFRIASIILLVIIGMVCVHAVFNLPTWMAPDEEMRMLIPKFIVENNGLPRGDEVAITDTFWGFSYALMPYFPSIIGAIFLKLASFFTSDPVILLGVTRLVSVFSILGTTYLGLKIGKLVLKSNSAAFLFGGLSGLLPQFVFLGMYLNNDAFSVFTTYLIFYSWILGMKSNWGKKSCIYLAIGNALCALTYYNGYAFIVFSVIIFIFSYLKSNPKDYTNLLKKGFFIFILAFALAGWYFIRNYLLFGDFLGLNTVKEFSETYGQFKPSQRPTPSNLGIGLKGMLLDMHWIKNSIRSFIGCFGYLTVSLSGKLYIIYITYICVGGSVGTLNFIVRWKRKDFYQKLLFISMCACIIIPIGLTVYNSYYSDFQAQGRYFMSILLPLMLLVTKGYDTIFAKLRNKIKFDGNYLAIGVYILLFMIVYIKYMLPMM